MKLQEQNNQPRIATHHMNIETLSDNIEGFVFTLTSLPRLYAPLTHECLREAALLEASNYRGNISTAGDVI